MSLRVGLLQPSANPRQLLELIELHLEATRLVSEVNQVELRAAIVGRLGERQGELFADRWPTDPHQLAILVNRLSSRLGYDRVLRAEPHHQLSAGAGSAVEDGTRSKSWSAQETQIGRQGDKETRRIADYCHSMSPLLRVSLSSAASAVALPRAVAGGSGLRFPRRPARVLVAGGPPRGDRGMLRARSDRNIVVARSHDPPRSLPRDHKNRETNCGCSGD